ncbi:MAG: hypothetical protein AB1451_12530 [Nitrospirota bacterium]
MRTSKLSQDVIDVLTQRGFAGRRVYVPVAESNRPPNLVTIFLPKLLAEVEADYERRGVTFFSEGSPRKVFSGNYGKGRIGARFNLTPRTAPSVSSAAWKRWRSGSPGQNGSATTSSVTWRTYLEIRQRLRAGEAVGLEEYVRYHNAPEALLERVKDLAQASIQSCPWRAS